tara:strand:+ start:322 stop:555 length:234 start_codon:yes stop_codon:yes gene_type:complete
MKIETFIEHLREEFTHIDEAELTHNADLFTVFRGSSLNILLIRAKIKDEYGVDLSDEQIKATKTISDLFSVIQKHVI